MMQNTLWSEFIDALIVKKVRRGAFASNVSLILALSLTAVAIQLGESGWAVSGFIMSWIFGFSALHLRNKHNMSVWLSRNPSEMLWIHAADQNGLLIDEDIETCGKLVLHMKNGYRLEAILEHRTRRQFDEWRKNAEPSVRWGVWVNEMEINQKAQQ